MATTLLERSEGLSVYENLLNWNTVRCLINVHSVQRGLIPLYTQPPIFKFFEPATFTSAARAYNTY